MLLFFKHPSAPELYTLSLHDALPICVFFEEQLGYKDFAFLTTGGRYDRNSAFGKTSAGVFYPKAGISVVPSAFPRSEEHTSELQSRRDLVCRLLLEKKNNAIEQDIAT